MSHKKIASGTVHNLPADLRAALVSDAAALQTWENITPKARNEWICWVISVKKVETRKDHVRRAQAELRDGERRPCCWYGCIHRTDKAISPSVKHVILKKR